MSQGIATVSQLLERSQVEKRTPFAMLNPANDRDFEEARIAGHAEGGPTMGSNRRGTKKSEPFLLGLPRRRLG
jgi:hypothetical protein